MSKKLHTIYDSRPLEADELWPEQVTILNSIYHHVENMIDDAGSRNWREGDNGNGAWASPEPKRTHRTLFLNGTRGIGKTSILLTALRSWNWHRISLQNSNKHNLNEDNKNNILSKFHEQGRSVLALPLLDFDQLSPKISSISWIILSFKNLVERATTMRSDLDKDRSNLLNRWQNFFKSTLTVWSPEPLSKSSSVDDYILDLQDACNGLFGIYGTWYDLIDNLIEKLHKNGDLSKNGVILVSIDDLDLNPGFILELLLAQRILWHPKLIFILSGDEERLKKSLEKELSKREESESSLLINLSTDIYDKFISRYYRISLPMATTLNAFSFSIGINYHRINHQGYLLERINSYLPNNENNEIKSFFVNLIMKNNDFERFKWRSIQFLKNEYSYEKIIISLMGIIFNDLIPNSDGEDLVNKLFQKDWFILPENNYWIELVTSTPFVGSSEFNRFYKTDHKSSYDFFVEIDGNLFRSNLPIVLDTFYHLTRINKNRITTTFPPLISILNKDYYISFILPTKHMNVSNILIYKEICEEILSKRPLFSRNYDYFFVKSWINEIIFDNAPLDDENITISDLIKTELRLTLDPEIFLLIGLLSSPEYSFSEDISNEILEALRRAINKKEWLNFCARLDEFRLTNIKNTLFFRNRIGNDSNQIDQNKYIEYINKNFRSSPWFLKERIISNWLINHNYAFYHLLKKTFFTKEYYSSASRDNPINLNLDLIDLFYFKSSRDFSIENQTWIGRAIDIESNQNFKNSLIELPISIGDNSRISANYVIFRMWDLVEKLGKFSITIKKNYINDHIELKFNDDEKIKLGIHTSSTNKYGNFSCLLLEPWIEVDNNESDIITNLKSSRIDNANFALLLAIQSINAIKYQERIEFIEFKIKPWLYNDDNDTGFPHPKLESWVAWEYARKKWNSIHGRIYNMTKNMEGDPTQGVNPNEIKDEIKDEIKEFVTACYIMIMIDALMLNLESLSSDTFPGNLQFPVVEKSVFNLIANRITNNNITLWFKPELLEIYLRKESYDVWMHSRKIDHPPRFDSSSSFNSKLSKDHPSNKEMNSGGKKDTNPEGNLLTIINSNNANLFADCPQELKASINIIRKHLENSNLFESFEDINKLRGVGSKTVEWLRQRANELINNQ